MFEQHGWTKSIRTLVTTPTVAVMPTREMPIVAEENEGQEEIDELRKIDAESLQRDKGMESAMDRADNKDVDNYIPAKQKNSSPQ